MKNAGSGNPNPSPATRFQKGKSGNPNGRLRKQVAARDLPVITKLASRGVRQQDIARGIGVCAKTWARIMVEDPAAQEAFNAGQAQMHDSLVGVLYERAMKGEIVPALFLLKTRFFYREQGDLSGQEAPRVTIVLPAPLSAEKYAQVIEHEGAPLLPAPDEATA
jgi:hypothetical protein